MKESIKNFSAKSDFPKSIFQGENVRSILANMERHTRKVISSAYSKFTPDQIKEGHPDFEKRMNKAAAMEYETNRFKAQFMRGSSDKNKEKKKSLLKEAKNKAKLKKLSLRGRGGGGSMKMPQEYSTRSLLKKPMS